MGTTTTSAGFNAAVAREPEAGHLVSRSPSDGVLWAVAYQRVTEFPLYVVVGQGTGMRSQTAWEAGAVSGAARHALTRGDLARKSVTRGRRLSDV